MDDWGTTNDSGDTWGATEGDDANNNQEKKDSGCRKCGEEGHFARECDKPDVCRKCKKEGHMAKDCEMTDVCYKCKKEGHMARDCDMPDTCRRCGEEGHMVRDCTQEEKTRTIEKEDGTKGEIYVPKELEEDKLFETGISSGINFDKFDRIKVSCNGENASKPIKSFEESGLRSLLLDNIKKCGYVKPTPIQKHSIPIIMEGRDMMGCAQTGSGKTGAFLLPILSKLLERGADPNTGACPQTPEAVIVAPTRELAIQIKDEARKFGNGSVLKSVVIYGGTSTGFQISTIMRGCNILIATPGRLMDFVDKGKVSFSNVKYLVLDEADRMLDMGFLPEMLKMISSADMPEKGKRQTLMFSATFPNEVQKLAIDFLDNYLFLSVGFVGGASADVTQTFHAVEKFSKKDKVKEILNEVGTEKTLVFVETKRNADFLACYLSDEGFPTTSIHGDRFQREREEALADFKSGRMAVLVATAVAARGLDIKGVAHVINYDLPKSIDEYVHRIGRTGRVGNLGKATSFFDERQDAALASSLVTILQESEQEVPDFVKDCATGGSSGFAQSHDIRGGQSVVSNAANDADDGW